MYCTSGNVHATLIIALVALKLFGAKIKNANIFYIHVSIKVYYCELAITCCLVVLDRIKLCELALKHGKN